jgi:REP element-mobilizing transposase RayT
MVRGMERRSIFLDDEDRARFLRRLEAVLADADARCFAFALMSNHYHLLVETGSMSLSRMLHRLGTFHAGDFNRRHHRCGHLYQNRFRSKPIDDEAGFLAVLRYIHLNPLGACIVPDLQALATWPWTGHAALLGNRKASFLATEEVLGRFGSSRAVARRALVAFMAGDTDGDAHLGDPVPSREAPAIPGEAGRWRDPGALDRECARIALESAGWDLERVIQEVCAGLCVSEEQLRAGRRTTPISRAREEIAWLAVERLGLRRVDVALATGVSHQAVTRALTRADLRAEALRARFPELVA